MPVWGPNRLRHKFGTMIRKESGFDTARACLGHTDAATPTIYAERDREVVIATMERVG